MSNGIRFKPGIIGGALLLLAGIHGKPMRAMRRAAMQTNVSWLNQRAPDSDTRVLVLFGSTDIYGPTTETLFARYPEEALGVAMMGNTTSYDHEPLLDAVAGIAWA